MKFKKSCFVHFFKNNTILLKTEFFKLKNSKPWVLNHKLLECEHIRKKYGTRWKDSCGMVTEDESGSKIFKFYKNRFFQKVFQLTYGAT